MTPDLQNEFRMLSERAEQQLKDIPESGSYQHVFSLWIMPSFSPSCRWTIYSPLPFAKGKPAFASNSVWRSDLDLDKLRSPIDRLRHPKDISPTMEHCDITLSMQTIEEYESLIRGISIPFFAGPPSVVGCDGTRYEFQFDHLFLGGAIHWWENHPDVWRPFTAKVMAIADDLENRKRTT